MPDPAPVTTAVLPATENAIAHTMSIGIGRFKRLIALAPVILGAWGPDAISFP